MKRQKISVSGKAIRLMIIILIFLNFAISLMAKENKRGAELMIKMRDGQIIKAELLAVKARDLILMDFPTFSEIRVGIDEVTSFQIIKKSKILQGLGYGSLVGGGSGALIGFLSGDDQTGLLRWTATDKAMAGGLFFGILGGICGGIAGAIKGLDESIDLEKCSPQEIDQILAKLDKMARFPQGQARTPIITSKNQIEDKPRKKETGPSAIKISNSKPSIAPKPVSSRFNRLHLTYRPGIILCKSPSMSLFEEIGFGDTQPEREVYLFFISLGTIPATTYPKLKPRGNFDFGDLRVNYSITRAISIGFGYSTLGNHTVIGYNYIPLIRGGEYYYSYLYLHENFSGKLYYLQFFWMPIPDAFIRKVSFLLGASAGLCQSKIKCQTSKYSYISEDNPGEVDDKVSFSKKSLALIGTAEFHYFFNRNFSLGIGAEYRYSPVKIGSLNLIGKYYDLDESMNVIESTMIVNVPAHKVYSGNFRFGLNAGLHF